jgi:hypothetical protein
MIDKAVQLIAVALDRADSMDARLTDKEWDELNEFCYQQAIIGVTYSAIKKLPEDQRPYTDCLLSWHMDTRLIEQQNGRANGYCVELTEHFRQAGYRSCILKGQGNALMYPEPQYRQCGDIDIWLDGERKDILRFVLNRYPDVHFAYHHVAYPLLKDAEVEVHYMPMYMTNPRSHRRLQRFLQEQKEACFANKVKLSEKDGEVAVPTPLFNAVYQMAHIFIHFLIEGIGLRHFMDYYYVLQRLTEEERRTTAQELEGMNLYRFARAVMYIEKTVFGLEDDRLLCRPDEKGGQRLLDEVAQAGNFGQFETRFWKKGGGFVDKNWQKLRRNSRFLIDYPGEVACEPMFRLYHAAWRTITKERYGKK